MRLPVHSCVSQKSRNPFLKLRPFILKGWPQTYFEVANNEVIVQSFSLKDHPCEDTMPGIRYVCSQETHLRIEMK